MGKLVNLGFEFNGSFYYTLIHMKQKDGWKEYYVTVMNGDLEKLLYGNHVIKEINGQIIEDVSPRSIEQAKLKLQITKALSVHLKNSQLK